MTKMADSTPEQPCAEPNGLAPGRNYPDAEVAELRRKIRSARGKIERRETAIISARRDIRDANEVVRMAQNRLRELGARVRS